MRRHSMEHARKEPILYLNKSYAFSKAGKKEKADPKQNQDSYLLLEKVFNIDNYYIYGIMDGHGPNGHLVSQYIKTRATELFNSPLSCKLRKCSDPSNMPISERYIKEISHLNNYCLIKQFNKTLSNDLKKQKFDIHFSGSTCILVFQIGNTLYISNTGDSSAIIVKKENNIFQVEPLSFDLPEERDRIIKKGGLIQKCVNNDGNWEGPYSFWFPNEKYPGIAVSRSIGDLIAESIGVSSEPDCSSKLINYNYKYMVLASDGIWEFLNNEQVMEIVNPFYVNGNVEGDGKALIDKSAEIWKKEDDVRDDITVIVDFFRNSFKDEKM